MLACTRPTTNGSPVMRSPRAMRCAPQRPGTATTRTPGADHHGDDQRVDDRDQRREAVDPDDAGQLRNRQYLDLAVAERYPRKSAERVAAQELGRHPRRGREDEAAIPEDAETGAEGGH